MAAVKADGPRPLVLIIDDDELVRRFVRAVLLRAGYAVVEASDGGPGLERFREHAPAVVITDIFMPGIEGLELIGLIRHEAPRVPIIAMSGAAAELPGCTDPLVHAALLGAARTLDKPFTERALLRAMRAVLPLPGAPPDDD